MIDQINYCLPGFYEGIEIYHFLLDLYETNKNIFRPGINFYKIFDSFPNCSWNGGGINFGKGVSLEEIEDVINSYNSRGVGLQFTATNPCLEIEDCYDRYGNAIVKAINNPLNEVLVASEILEKYLRDKYPNLKISRSILATKNDINYDDLVNKYEHIVLPKRAINNSNILDSITFENRCKMELLCNDPCPISCPRLYEHYKDFADITLYKTKYNEKKVNCIYNENILHNPLYQISPEEISKYTKKGYNLFKISGRHSIYDIIYSIIPYLIKPEYHFEIACKAFEIYLKY